MKYRLYTDESGDHTYKQLDHVRRRYLGLTGVAIEFDYYRNEFEPRFEALKQSHFPHDPDEPVILHREDIYWRRGPFGVLKDPERNAKWEEDFIEFVKTTQFRLLTVVLNKKSHIERYGGMAIHPYYMCMTLLLERYRGCLMYVKAKGDVLAESRGGTEDLGLKEMYRRIWRQGTFYISAQEFQKVLTTRELKVKRKEGNSAGLQLADLLAHPSKCDILAEHEKITLKEGSFSERLIGSFMDKYDLIGRKLVD